MRKGIFYEVGAQFTTLSMLLEKDWKDRVVKRQGFVPLDMVNRFDCWEGFFVEPLGEVMAFMLKHHRSHWNAHYIQCAVAGSNALKKADIVSRNPDEWKMATIKSKSGEFHYEREGIEKITDFYIPTLSLDSLFASLECYPDLLRIDVEGMEVEALENYSFNPAPCAITIDVHNAHSDGVNEDLIKSILEGHGYTMSHIRGDLLAEREIPFRFTDKDERIVS